MKLALAVFAFALAGALAGPARAQSVPSVSSASPASRVPDFTCDPADPAITSHLRCMDDDELTATLAALPEKPLPPLPPPARLGDWYRTGETMGAIDGSLVLVPRKDDGRWAWHVEHVGSCAWCGEPMSWQTAALDRRALPLWALAVALKVADIEVTHSRPCFRSGECTEGNPLLGRSRAQGYSVSLGIAAFQWASGAWLRKGRRETRVGGWRYWWIVPLLDVGFSGVAVGTNIARGGTRREGGAR